MANKWVYMFSEGDMTMRNLLGGKGANLAEMTSIGLPVPQGFTITPNRGRFPRRPPSHKPLRADKDSLCPGPR